MVMLGLSVLRCRSDIIIIRDKKAKDCQDV